MSSSPSTRPMSRSPARDGPRQSTVAHPRRANSSAAGLRSGSEACCSHFLGSCRELTVHDFFCKTQIWKVSSQLRSKAAGFESVGQRVRIQLCFQLAYADGLGVIPIVAHVSATGDRLERARAWRDV